MATPLRHDDLGRGLDGFRPENKLRDGYWLRSKNLDPLHSGSLKKREGYQRFGGLVPLRVASLTRSGTALRISFGSWVDHSSFRSRPIIMFGRATATIGSIAANNATYQYATFTATSTYIEVTTANTGATSDTSPQLNVYGLDVLRFDAISSSAGSRPGWVHHLDTYRRGSDSWPVCAMEGVLYAAREQADYDSSLSTTRAPWLRAVASTEHRVGPAFWESAPSPALTRGCLIHADASEHVVPLSAVAWVSGTTVRFTVSGAVTIGAGSLSTILRANLDRLTVEQAPYAALNGTHKITGATLDGTTLTIDCSIASVTDSRFDASSILAYGSVLTDSVVSSDRALPPDTEIDVALATQEAWTAAQVDTTNNWLDDGDEHGFSEGEALVYVSASGTAIGGLEVGETYYARMVPGNTDRLRLTEEPGGSPIDFTSAGVGTHTFRRVDDAAIWRTVACSGTRTAFDGVTQSFVVSGGAILAGRRAGRVWRLRTADATATVSIANFVEGDVLKVDGMDGDAWTAPEWPDPSKRPTIVNARSNTASLSISSIVGDGELATATTSSTSELSAGDWHLLIGSENFSGDIQIVEVLSSTQFTFTSTVEATETTAGMEVLADVVALDEAIELVDDARDNSVTFIPHRRWVAVERPTSANSTLIDATTNRHFDYFAADEQPFLRSAMASDSMYLFNGYDEPQKYDGVSISRAGLPPLQLASLGGTTRLAPPGGRIENPDAGSAVSAFSGGVFTVAAGQATKYPAGTQIRFSNGTAVDSSEYGGLVIDSDGDTIVGTAGRAAERGDSSGTLFRDVTLGYYVRLNAIDRNGRTTASATTQINDQLYSFGRASLSQLKIVRPAAFAGFDHARWEIEIYRRPFTGEPVFSLLRRYLVDWTTDEYYIDFRDFASDAALFAPNLAPKLDGDRVLDALVGAERAPTWDLVPRASVVTAASSRVILGDVKSYPRFSIVLQPDTSKIDQSFNGSSLAGAVFYFRRGGATSTTPDNSSVQVFELVDSDDSSRYRDNCQVHTSADSDPGRFQVYAPSALPVGVAVGDWVYLTTRDDALAFAGTMAHQDFTGWFQIAAIDSGRNYIEVTRSTKRSFAFSSVDTAANTITLASAHGIPVGLVSPVTFSDLAAFDLSGPAGAAGTLPAPIVKQRTYYAAATSATAFSLYSDAELSSAVDLTTTGSGSRYAIFAAAFIDDGTENDYSIYFASDPRRVPVVLPDFTEADSTWDGYKTLPLQSVTSGLAIPNFIAIWLAHAINSAQSAAVATSGFRPWLHARAGEDFAPGELFVESPVAETTTPTVEIDLSATYPVKAYVNGAAATGSRQDAETKEFPYRLLVSYKNYPEIFDNPFVQDDKQSDSAIDIDPATGGRVVAAIPLFGDSTFGAGLKDALVLVSKEDEWYVVNVETKEVRSLQLGKGVSFPRSVALTKNGVAFANRGGMYKVNRSLDLTYLGEILGRKWKNVDRSDDVDTDVPCGHNDRERNRYAFSYAPVNAENGSDAALVYDHTREVATIASTDAASAGGLGSWTEYEFAHPALGWANFGQDSLMASTAQRVFSRRRAGDESDFRDDDQAIEADGIYKLLDFGALGLRKVLRGLVACFRTETTQSGTEMSWADSARLAFQDFDEFELEIDEDDALTAESSANLKDVRLSAPNRKGDLMTLRVQNAAIDEGMELTELVFLVDPIGEHGVRQAAEDDS